MAISSAGIGSGLDVNSLVSQLVAAERAPQENRLLRTQSKLSVTLSAIGSFKSALAQLQTAARALTGTDNTISKLSSSVSTEGLFTAAAGSKAVAGRYEIEVMDIARAHKVTTTAFAGGSTSVVGTGSVTIDVGAESFTVNLASGADTLADLRDAINSASDNPGVTATLLTEDAGTRLVLTSSKTGTTNGLTVSSEASGGGALLSTSTLQAATDAQIKVEGYTHTSSSNTITSAIEGVTLNLLRQEPGTVVTLDLKQDAAASSKAIKDFVTAYNAVVGVVKKFGGYDAASKTGGPLMGESSVRSATQQIRSVIGDVVGEGAYSMLAQIGIKSAADGTLNLDTGKLDAGLAADADAVKTLFSSSQGLATRLDSVIDGFIGDDGRIAAQSEQLQKRIESLGDQAVALERRMAQVEARYRKQFTALDTLLGQMQSTGNYLSQQLANLPGGSSR